LRSTLRATLAACLAVVSPSVPSLSADAAPQERGKQPSPSIAGLAVELDAGGGGVRLDYHVEAAFDARLREEIDSGLPVRFEHRIEVRRRRTMWWDETVAAKTITTSAVRDAETHRYTLTRQIDGGTVETVSVSGDGEMERFMTGLEGVTLSLPGDLPAGGRLEVRVRATLETRFFLFFPYDFDTGWARQSLPASVASREPVRGR
jgi:uncharacterized protein DUF4390